MDIKHSLRWHDPGRFNGYVLSRHLAGTPVAINLRDTLGAVKQRAASPTLGALRFFKQSRSAHSGRNDQRRLAFQGGKHRWVSPSLSGGSHACFCRVGPGNFTPSLSQIRT